MKNIKYLKFVFIFTLLLSGCSKDESVNLVEPNHRVIVTSEMNFENTINIGGHIDFGDLSRGIQTRTWTFPEDASYISGEDGNTSSKDVVKGIFTKPGVYDVTLNQMFKGNVYPNEDSTEPIEGKELDTTIVVTVLDNIAASIQINYINDDGSLGDALSLSDNAENEVVASKYVRISQNSSGDPSDFNWVVNGAKPDQVSISDDPDAITDVRYTKLGTWDLQFIASRTRPGGADTIYVKNFVKVIPSTEPVTLDRVFELEAQTKIGLEFSREIDPATVNRNHFSVTIDTNAGGTITPEVANVTVDPNEGSIVIIEIANEVMYNDDTVKVSYTPGTLTTLDAVASDAFTDVVLTDFIKTNLLESSAVDYSFETTIEDNWPYLWWGGIWAEYDMNLSFNRAHTGDKSMFIDFRVNGGMVIGHRDGAGNDITFSVEKGFKYEMGAWVYIENLGNVTGESNIRMFWNPGTNWGIGDNIVFNSTSPTGDWFYSSGVVEFATSGEVSYMIRGISTNTERLKVYIDDLTLFKLTSRP